jgi:hypothetical protein
MSPLSARSIDVSLSQAKRTAIRFAGGRPPRTRCGGPAWVPVALVALEIGRRLLSELDARPGCATDGPLPPGRSRR